MPLGHQRDTVHESSILSDVKVSACVLTSSTSTPPLPTTSFADVLEALRVFPKPANDTEADLGDSQGTPNKSATFSAAATKFERLCDSQWGAGQCAAPVPYANPKQEVGDAECKTILPGRSHKNNQEAMRTLQGSSEERGTRHQSCVSILRLPTHYSRLEETQRCLNSTNSQLYMEDEAFNMTLDNFGFSDSTSSHQDRSVEDIVNHECFLTSDNDTIEGEHFLRMPLKN